MNNADLSSNGMHTSIEDYFRTTVTHAITESHNSLVIDFSLIFPCPPEVWQMDNDGGPCSINVMGVKVDDTNNLRKPAPVSAPGWRLKERASESVALDPA